MCSPRSLELQFIQFMWKGTLTRTALNPVRATEELHWTASDALQKQENSTGTANYEV